ncbi:MAG: aryl-sulfate sulfotransferase [Planctomycetota bacterium]
MRTRRIVVCLLPLILLFLAADRSVAQVLERSPEDRPSGLVQSDEGAFSGYTLFAPLRSTTTYLIDMQGKVVHQWESKYNPGNSVYLLENGHLLRTAREPDNPVFRGGGEGGRIQEFSWEGELVWEYVCSSEERLHHHDIAPMPNGHVLLIAWERKSKEEALAVGRSPELLESGELWPDYVLEVEPTPPQGGRVVWEWHSFDHLVQDRDPKLPDFGEVAKHPERIDINGDRLQPKKTEAEEAAEDAGLRALGYLGGAPPEERGRGGPRGGRGADWLHTNSIDYNAKLDQILLSIRQFSEIWIIDHGTTTEEAAGCQGGARGKGGDLLYRFGNPARYGAGEVSDRQLFVQHDARWIPAGFPGAGNILVFNNGEGRDRNYSSVDEIRPPVDPKGNYTRKAGQPFGPKKAHWSYGDRGKHRFFSGNISGAERLPNGNTLICDGTASRLFEVTGEGEVVWDYVSPFAAERPGPPGQGRPGIGRRGNRRGPPGAPQGGPGGGGGPGGIFRATRLAADYPGLAGLLPPAPESKREV